jgi:replication factor C subunit 2/4
MNILKEKLKYLLTNIFMNKSFLKKYQPLYYKDFIIEKDYISLLNTLKDMDNLNILIVGNHGSGKTSLLEATIKEYYDEYKNINKINNILYINNLKEQGIQYYRNEVKTFCQTKSLIPGKKKFIVLDDIDNINEQSQQVFRNCIDKYSHNINFICSCLNTQKVIDSIQSRCTIIKIKPIQKKLLEKICKNIQIKESIKITKEANEFLINISNNSIRQIINNLEKFKILNKEINIYDAKNICTNISFFEFEIYTKLWIAKDIQKASKTILNIINKGYSVMDILDGYFSFIKFTDIIEQNIKYKVIKIICKYITIFHNTHENHIELILFTQELTKI